MLKTTGSSVASAFRFDNNEIVGDGGAAGAESGKSILKQKVGSIVLSTWRTKKVSTHHFQTIQFTRRYSYPFRPGVGWIFSVVCQL